MCLTSALPKILTEVETFGERCNVLEVVAVLHQDVGKAGNRPADVDDGEDDDGDLGTKTLSSFRL